MAQSNPLWSSTVNAQLTGGRLSNGPIRGLALFVLTALSVSCSTDGSDEAWVSVIISGRNCGEFGKDALRAVGSKTNFTIESCNKQPYFFEFELRDDLIAQGIVPAETTCGLVQDSPVFGISPFLPNRAYHFRVTSLQAEKMLASGKFMPKETYDATEMFAAIPCERYGVIPKP
jgi:hypothetical protein